MDIKLLLVDDHPVVRKGLSFFLEKQPAFRIIGEAANGQEALAFIQQEKPDVIVMDLSMPVMDGIQAARAVKEFDPSIKVLMLTSFAEQDYVLPALEAGADGYQLKEVEPDQLVAAIMAVYQGSTNLHPKVTPAVFAQLRGKQEERRDALDTLTRREKDVLKQIAAGKSNKEIAAALHITEQTVKTHVSNVLAKLNLDDRTQAALYAVKRGFGL